MISHKHKTIFIHIPKCGGQSIEDAFIKDNGLDWASRDPLLLRKNPNLLVGPPWLAHLTARDYLDYCYISEELFNAYYKFTVVRNPYSRVESIYKYLGYNSAISFKKFVERVVVDENQFGAGRYYFFKPQTDFFMNEKGEIQVNDIFRLEDIDDVYQTIIRNSDLRVEKFHHINKSMERRFIGSIKRRFEYACQGYWDLRLSGTIEWDRATRKTVNEVYSKDFQVLGYDLLEQ